MAMRATELLTSLMHDINKRLPEGAQIRFLYQEKMGIADQNYSRGLIHDYRDNRIWDVTFDNLPTREKYFPPYVIVSDLRASGGSLRLADLRDIVLESEM